MNENSKLINRYQLLEQRGKGGMAYVYRARDLLLERDVAVKVLREDFSHDASFQQNFLREARSVANLSHPNLVTIHDYGLEKGLMFIVMEYVPGMDLKSLLLQKGKYSVDEALPLIIQACAGIGYAHRAGLVHCDIKPQNLLIMPDQRLKVTDFGIARAFVGIQPDDKVEVVWGSPQYFSPEQASGKAPTPASDVYSLGIVLFEMLTGSPPFIAQTGMELARMHLEEEPPKLSSILPDASSSIERIIGKLLSKEPTKRYRTADQLGRVLQNFGSNNIEENPTLALTPDLKSGFFTRKNSKFTKSSYNLDLDWLSISLGMVTLLMVGGLIPFWVWIYFLYNPPIR